jgi:3'(2'), 5'-bisphosphate nucleotidase
MHTATVVLAKVLENQAQIQNLARQAGELIMTVYKTKSRGNLGLKDDQSPVTEADQLAHDSLSQGLSKLFPAVIIISEEGEEVFRPIEDCFWLIDPLDGTKEFLNGTDEFTINLALISHGQVVWGLVYAPALDQMYWGGKGLGSWRLNEGNIDKLVLIPNAESSQPCRVLASKNHLNSETKEWVNKWKDISMTQAGSSLKFCRIAENLADLYPRLAPTCEWDTAAAQAILEGSGGHVYDLNGIRLHYGKSEILNPSFIASRWSWSELLVRRND